MALKLPNLLRQKGDLRGSIRWHFWPQKRLIGLAKWMLSFMFNPCTELIQPNVWSQNHDRIELYIEWYIEWYRNYRTFKNGVHHGTATWWSPNTAGHHHWQLQGWGGPCLLAPRWKSLRIGEFKCEYLWLIPFKNKKWQWKTPQLEVLMSTSSNVRFINIAIT